MKRREALWQQVISRDAALLSARYLKRMAGGGITPVETFDEFRKGHAVELTGN